jgi:hypothetical protein
MMIRMISHEAPAVMNLLKPLSLLASYALVQTEVANSDVQSHTKMELTKTLSLPSSLSQNLPF